jgi:hypothetical protein
LRHPSEYRDGFVMNATCPFFRPDLRASLTAL